MTRLNPDSRVVVALTVALTLGVAGVSFVLSFASLSEAALWGRVRPELSWGVPVLIDASVLVYTFSALIQRARGERAGLSWFLLTVFSLTSVLANAAHAWGIDGTPRLVVGTVLVSLAPVGVLASVHTLATLVTKHPEPVPVPESVPIPVVKRERPPAWDSLSEPALSAPVVSEPAVAGTGSTGALNAVPERVSRKRTPESVAQVLALRRQGLTQREIARRLGWSVTLVQSVCREARESQLLAA